MESAGFHAGMAFGGWMAEAGPEMAGTADAADGAAWRAPLRRALADLPAAGTDGIPRVIWQFWHSGLADAPDVVRRSHETWRHFNPGHRLRFLSLADAEAALGVDLERMFSGMTVEIGWAGKSDLLRLLLLARFGGIWADATTFCLRPLADWLHPQADGDGFFCFRHLPGLGDRELVSWFMAAAPGHPIIRALLDEVVDYLYRPRDRRPVIATPRHVRAAFDLMEGDRPGRELLDRCEAERGWVPYFWMFYLFEEVTRRQPEAWARVRAMSNRRVQATVPLPQFRNADVAKQNKGEKYLGGEIYQARLKALFDGDRIRADFGKRKGNPAA